MRFKIKPYKHQLEIIEMSKTHRDLALLWEMGCLTGNSRLHVNYDRRTYGVMELHDVLDKIDNDVWDINKLKVMSMKEEGIGLNTVKDIFRTGIKHCYRMQLENGNCLVATGDHKIYTSDGWKKLEECLGLYVAVDVPKVKKDKATEQSKGERQTNRSVSYSKCVSLKPVGSKPTYDMTMEHPYDNYIANNIVVHNSGKTGGIINVLRYKYLESKKLRRTLILGPLVTLYNWKNEFKLHSNISQDSIVICEGNKQKKLKGLKRLFSQATCKYDSDAIVAINYESLLSADIMNILVEWRPEIIVFDESHYIKNHKSKRSKAAVRLADLAKHRYILTGTAILKNAQDIFMQFRALDLGDTFGKNFYAFQRTYMQDANSAWSSSHQHFPKWELRSDKEQEINEKIYKKATQVKTKDCIDLPPLIKQEIELDMTPKQAKLYKEMKRDLITFIDNNKGEDKAVIAQIAVVKAIRLMQIASGFVTTDDGETIEIANNPKSKAIIELLETLVEDNKVILWCAFKPNYAQLAAICDKLCIKYTMLTGEQNLKQKEEAMNTFRKDPKCRVIIANRRAGGIGINLVEAKYSIVVSRNFSLADELQSEARNFRGGSQIHDKVVKIDLVMRDTVERDVINSLNNKQDIANRILNMIR